MIIVNGSSTSTVNTPEDTSNEAVTPVGDIGTSRYAAPLPKTSPELQIRPQLEQSLSYAENLERMKQDAISRDSDLIKYNEAKNAGSSDVWSAAFRTENSVISWFAREPMPQFQDVEGYNPFNQFEDGTTDIDGFEPFAELFVESNSPQQTSLIKERIKREMQDRQVLAESPVEGFIASMAAGVTDPINLATLLIPVARETTVAKMMGYAASSAVVTEMALHQTQDTRTVEESLANSIGSALITGALGSAIGYLTRNQRDAILKQMIDGDDAPVTPQRTAEIQQQADLAPAPVRGDDAEGIDAPTVAKREPPKSVQVEKVEEGTVTYHGRTQRLSEDARHREMGLHTSSVQTVAYNMGRRFSDEGETDSPRVVLHEVPLPAGNYLRTVDVPEEEVADMMPIAESLGYKFADEDEFQDWFLDTGSFSPEQMKVKLVHAGFDVDEVAKLADTDDAIKTFLKDYGFDGLVYSDELSAMGGPASDSYMLFDVPRSTRAYETDVADEGIYDILETDQIPFESIFDDVQMPRMTANGPSSVGAMAVEQTSAEVALNGPLSRLAALLVRATPLGRLIQSPLASIRALTHKLIEKNIKIDGDYSPTSVESMIKRDYAKFNIAISEVRSIQAEWANKTGQSGRDFSRLVVRSMRRGDQSPDPLIAKAAQRLRKEMDELWNKAYEANLNGTYTTKIGDSGDTVKAPLETTTAQSYMTRRYDLNMARNNPEGFKKAWMLGIREQRERLGQEPLDDLELYSVANDIYDKVINLYDGELHFEVGPSGAAMLKQRVDVKDEFLEDFLVMDWENLINGYVKSLSPRVRMAEMFGDGDGDFTLASSIFKIRDQFSMKITSIDQKIDEVKGQTKNKLIRSRDKLIRELESNVRDIEVMRDRLLNMNQEASWMNPENRGVLSALRSARSWNIVASLSNIVISSIPDLARVITYHGGIKFARAFVKSAFSRELSRSNLPKNELAKIASAMERASAYRLSHVTEVEDGVVYTRADKYSHKAAEAVMLASGSKHWNSTFKTVVGYLFSDKLAVALNSNDTAVLKSLGMTDKAIEEARKELQLHGTKESGMWNLNIDRWSNKDLIESIEATAIREADSVIVTPSVGDKPLFMTTEVGKTLFQFMSFVMSATNKMSLPLMQEKGFRPWMEITMHLGLGAGVYYMKQAMAGKEPSSDPAIVLAEAISNTGLAGYSAQLLNAATGLTGVSPLSDEGMFYQHDGLSRVMGPTGGLVNNLLRIPNSQTSAEQRAKAIRRLMPMQNHFVLRKGYDQIEEQMAEMFNQVGGGSTPNL